MMKTRLYIGDSHGRFGKFNKTIEAAVSNANHPIDEAVSVGDFGYFPKFGYQYCSSHLDIPVRFIDGNHDDHDSLATEILPNTIFQAEHISRGTVESSVLFMGGATSIDKHMRTPGTDWWAGENISQRQYYQALENIETAEDDIKVMVAHDSICSAYPLLIDGNKYGFAKDPNAIALEQLFKEAQPLVYIHGHHHVSKHYMIGGTKFISLERCDCEEAWLHEVAVLVRDDGVIIDLPKIKIE